MGDTARVTAVARNADGTAVSGAELHWKPAVYAPFLEAFPIVGTQTRLRALVPGSTFLQASVGAVTDTVRIEAHAAVASYRSVSAGPATVCGAADHEDVLCWGGVAGADHGETDPIRFRRGSSSYRPIDR